ncbi:MAG TPA: Nudix family hydrolase, partial [Luteimonas sp.]|nr:Nudix family hydrolase [Luteimonas sp.]
EAALVRELQEELGIHVDPGPALIRVPQAYPGKRLALDVRRVSTWRGTARGREGQALAWVPPDRLPRYPMPPADRPVVAALLDPDRYLVTPEPGADGDAGWLRALEQALAGGIRRVQLRLKTVEPGRRSALQVAAAALCRRAGASVLVNGDAEAAERLHAGLHLPASRLHALEARPLPAERPLAASCHDARDLQQAQRLGCDFVVLGPVQATASHPGAEPMGWERFARLREQVSLPIYAIGGLAPADVAVARQHGAQGIAAIRGLWDGQA